MILIQPRHVDDEWLRHKGTWKRSRIANIKQDTAFMSCPDCGEIASLVDHDIAADGTVSPSVVCPHEGCSFHDYVKLEGWSG